MSGPPFTAGFTAHSLTHSLSKLIKCPKTEESSIIFNSNDFIVIECAGRLLANTQYIRRSAFVPFIKHERLREPLTETGLRVCKIVCRQNSVRVHTAILASHVSMRQSKNVHCSQ